MSLPKIMYNKLLQRKSLSQVLMNENFVNEIKVFSLVDFIICFLKTNGSWWRLEGLSCAATINTSGYHEVAFSLRTFTHIGSVRTWCRLTISPQSFHSLYLTHFIMSLLHNTVSDYICQKVLDPSITGHILAVCVCARKVVCDVPKH